MERDELIYALKSRLNEINRDKNFYEYMCVLVELKQETRKNDEYMKSIENSNSNDITYSNELPSKIKKEGFFLKLVNFFKRLFGKKDKKLNEEDKIINTYNEIIQEEKNNR